MPFTERLTQSIEPLMEEIIDCPIILCLARQEEIAIIDLLQAKRDFYVQDYYYLVYGYKVVNNILLDRRVKESSNLNEHQRNLEEKIRDVINFPPEDEESSIRKIRDLTRSSSIAKIEEWLESSNISLFYKSIYENTKNYILFKINNAFDDDHKAIVISFACIYVYQKIQEYHLIKTDTSRNEYESELNSWIADIWAIDLTGYLRPYSNYLDALQLEEASKTDLTRLFQEACFYEYLLFLSIMQ